jgi:Ser/Thr protein kinase RdoA (MazF antagonist)
VKVRRRNIRLHGDCHPGNILWREEGDFAGPLFVDLDDACMGPAVQDLWMLLSGDREAMQGQLSHVLNGYRAFMDFNAAELALIEPLRALRMIHHSAWIADRWDDPAFPAAFQFLQAPLIATPVFSYALSSGAFANLFITLQHAPRLGFDWSIATHGWLLALGGPSPAHLGINLLALVSWLILRFGR